MKVLINTCFGGFAIPDAVCDLYEARTGNGIMGFEDELHYDQDLIAIIEEVGLGENNNGEYGNKIEIVEIPDGYECWISDYDGYEEIHLKFSEQYLRELIREGNADDIVNYVMLLK